MKPGDPLSLLRRRYQLQHNPRDGWTPYGVYMNGELVGQFRSLRRAQRFVARCRGRDERVEAAKLTLGEAERALERAREAE